jgi:hypothetical protein
MALGVAQGMQALEAAEPPVLHRDLKPSNVRRCLPGMQNTPPLKPVFLRKFYANLRGSR